MIAVETTFKRFRIRSGPLLKFLDAASRVLSLKIFIPIHEVVRLLHLFITRPVLALVLRSRCRSARQVFLRHSQTGVGQYHILLSDVDVTLVVSDLATDTEIESVARLFELLRQVFLFLGEVEIYSESEFETKLQIESAWPEVFELSRLTKKFSWVSPNSGVPYHELKSSRSLRRTTCAFEKLKNALSVLAILEASRADTHDHEITAARAASLTRLFGIGFDKLDHSLRQFFSLLAPLYPDDLNFFASLETQTTGLPNLRFFFGAFEMIQANGRLRMLAAHQGLGELDLLKSWISQLDISLSQWSKALAVAERLAEFDVYGVRIRVSIEDAHELQTGFLTALKSEFGFFESDPTLRVPPQINIRIAAAQKRKQTVFFELPSSLGRVGVGFNFRRLVSPSGSTIEVRARKESTEICFWSSDASEIALLVNAVHSTLGERLEKRGFIRLHAAAYKQEGSAHVISGPTGAGKSTFIANALVNSSVPVFSDETTLFLSGSVYCYPTPVSLEPTATILSNAPFRDSRPSRVLAGRLKILISLPFDRVATCTPLETIVAIEEGALRKLTWICRVVTGLGLPQMWPYLIRIETIPFIFRTALKRFVFAFRMIKNKRVTFQSKIEFWDGPN